MITTIERDDLKRAIDSGEVTVVETLRAEHFEQGHLCLLYTSDAADE